MSEYATSILVTGGTQGMGYHCSLAIAKQCPKVLVVVASRTDPEDSAATINKTLNQSNVKYMPLDLGTLATVRSFVQTWKDSNHPPIQALVLNAGMQFPNGLQLTSDGIEKMFAINHVGHSLLFHLLLPSLTPNARIVITSSGVHDPSKKWGMKPVYTTAAEVARPSAEDAKNMSGSDRYATSKLASVLWTYALARRLSTSAAGKDKTVVAFDPGLMFGTNSTREHGAVVRWLAGSVSSKLVPLCRKLINENIHAPQESGASLAWLAVGEDVNGKSGVYYEGRKEIDTSEDSKVEAKQDDLWNWTVEFIGEGNEERERFGKLE